MICVLPRVYHSPRGVTLNVYAPGAADGAVLTATCGASAYSGAIASEQCALRVPPGDWRLTCGAMSGAVSAPAPGTYSTTLMSSPTWLTDYDSDPLWTISSDYAYTGAEAWRAFDGVVVEEPTYFTSGHGALVAYNKDTGIVVRCATTFLVQTIVIRWNGQNNNRRPKTVTLKTTADGTTWTAQGSKTIAWDSTTVKTLTTGVVSLGSSPLTVRGIRFDYWTPWTGSYGPGVNEIEWYGSAVTP